MADSSIHISTTQVVGQNGEPLKESGVPGYMRIGTIGLMVEDGCIPEETFVQSYELSPPMLCAGGYLKDETIDWDESMFTARLLTIHHIDGDKTYYLLERVDDEKFPTGMDLTVTEKWMTYTVDDGSYYTENFLGTGKTVLVCFQDASPSGSWYERTAVICPASTGFLNLREALGLSQEASLKSHNMK